MANSKQRRLHSTLAALEQRHGPGVVRRAADVDRRLPPHIRTGFPALDELTGCGGVPLGAMTLLSGRSTSGKLTVAFKVLAHAQQHQTHRAVALLDLNHTADPDYLHRAGVDLARLQIVRPAVSRQAVDVLIDLARTRTLTALVVNGLANFQTERGVYRYLIATLGLLHRTLAAANCALLWIDDPSPPWLRRFNLDRSSPIRPYVALHVDLQWEQWLRHPTAADITGYRAQAHLLKSRWAAAGRAAPVAIEFNGTIKTRETW